MAKKTHEIELKLKAADETGSAFKSALAHLKEIEHEQRASGEHALEGLARGAGPAALAFFAVEAFTSVSDAATKAMQEVKSGELSATEGMQQFGASALQAIPAVGKLFEAGESFHRLMAELADSLHVPEDVANAAVNSAGLGFLFHSDAVSKARKLLENEQDAANAALKRSMTSDPNAQKRLDMIRSFQQQEKEYAKMQREMSFGLEAGPEQNAFNAEAEQNAAVRHKAFENDLQQFDEQVRVEKKAAQQRFYDELGVATAQANAKQMQIDGQGAEGEIALLKATTKARIDELHLRAAQEADEVKRAVLEKQAIEMGAVLKNLAAITEHQIRRAQYEQMTEERKQFLHQLADLDDAAAAQRLRNINSEADAETKAMEAKHRKENQDLQDRYDAELKALGERPDPSKVGWLNTQFNERATALQRRQQAEGVGLGQDQWHRAVNQKESVGNQLVQSRIELLRAEAELGNALAAQELARLETGQRFNQQIQEYNRQLREGKDLTDQEKSQIEEARDIAIVSRNLGNAKVGIGAPTHPFAPGGELGRGQIGLGAAAEARAAGDRLTQERQLLDQARDQVENLKAIRSMTDMFQRFAPTLELFLQQQTQNAGTGGGDLLTDSNF